MYAISKKTLHRILEENDDLLGIEWSDGEPLDVRTDYSGRGMYGGGECIAFVGSSALASVFALAVAKEIAAQEADVAEGEPVEFEEVLYVFSQLMAGHNEDSMGRSSLSYWSNLKLEG